MEDGRDFVELVGSSKVCDAKVCRQALIRVIQSTRSCRENARCRLSHWPPWRQTRALCRPSGSPAASGDYRS